jgi:hypothetical protein
MVFNPLRTISSPYISATLLYADGHEEQLPEMAKAIFARHLVARALALPPLQ